MYNIKWLLGIAQDDRYTAKIIENNAKLDAAVTIGIVRVKAKPQITSRI